MMAHGSPGQALLFLGKSSTKKVGVASDSKTLPRHNQDFQQVIFYNQIQGCPTPNAATLPSVRLRGTSQMCKFHSQILVSCMFRSVSLRLDDNDTLKCHTDNFAKALTYLVIMENCPSSNYEEKLLNSIEILSHTGRNFYAISNPLPAVE